MAETLYSLNEVAVILKVKRETVRKLILQQKLSAIIVGKQYRISESQLQDFYKRNTLQPSE